MFHCPPNYVSEKPEKLLKTCVSDVKKDFTISTSNYNVPFSVLLVFYMYNTSKDPIYLVSGAVSAG